MVRYRPHRGSLLDAMAEAKNFNSIEEMFDYILDDWNKSGFGYAFSKSDLSVSENLGADRRINWKECRYILTKRMGDKVYESPQCIGMCSIE